MSAKWKYDRRTTTQTVRFSHPECGFASFVWTTGQNQWRGGQNDLPKIAVRFYPSYTTDQLRMESRVVDFSARGVTADWQLHDVVTLLEDLLDEGLLDVMRRASGQEPDWKIERLFPFTEVDT